MNTENIITSIVNTLLHSLWQAPLIAILLYISIAGLKLRSRTKYILSLSSLFFIIAVSITTFIYNLNPSNNISNNLSTIQATSLTIANDQNSDFSSIEQGLLFIERYSEMIFVFWLLGMLIFLIKFGIDLYYANSIKKKEYTEVNETFLHRFKSIAKRMGVRKSVKFLESSLIKVPVVIGHLKPVILLPLGLVTKIPNDQIEAIISHELAHIMRNDFLHNLIQSVIEIIYFFNPAIYWISKQIRTERENCCDDLAMKYCSDSVDLAKGLYNLQSLQVDVPKPMMAAVNNGDLLSRIKRIIGKESSMTKSYTGFIASIIVMFLAVTIFTGCTLFAGSKDEIKTEEASVIIVKKSSDGEEVKMDVFVTDGGDEDIEKQIFITTTDDGNKTITIISDGEENVWISKNEDFDFDFDFDFDIDIDFDEITESLEKALEEIDKKDLTDKEKAKAKAEVKEAIKELKSEEHNFRVEVKAAKAEVKAARAEAKAHKFEKIIIKTDKDNDHSKIKLIENLEISKIQDELVKDGILKEKSEELIIFIDDDVIKINDKEIPAKHKEKYKKLLGGF